MRGPKDLVAEVERKLGSAWAAEVVHLAGLTRPRPVDPAADEATPAYRPLFPLNVSTSLPSRKADVERDFPSLRRTSDELRVWAPARGLDATPVARKVKGTDQELIGTVTIPDLDCALALVAGAWPRRIKRARHRLEFLRERFPGLETRIDPVKALRATDDYRDVDFNLLLEVTAWFLADPTRGIGPIRPRQLPIPGVHTKWVNHHRTAICALTGLPRIDVESHPGRFRFTYLDPHYRSSGRRRHDSGTVGDPIELPYVPQFVVISENKDTAIYFPPVPGGIAVEGEGAGPRTIASASWIQDCPLVLYWGDIDADGFEILSSFRAAGLPVVSMLMDHATYEAYEAYGTAVDKNSRPLTRDVAKQKLYLSGAERALYESLIDHAWTRFRRVEQERIDDVDILAAVAQAQDLARRSFGGPNSDSAQHRQQRPGLSVAGSVVPDDGDLSHKFRSCP